MLYIMWSSLTFSIMRFRDREKVDLSSFVTKKWQNGALEHVIIGDRSGGPHGRKM